MPPLLLGNGSNRLKKVKKASDEGPSGTAALRRGVGVGGDPKSSLVSFISVSNNSDSASDGLNKVQRSGSFKRRFGFNNILTRGKNRTNTGQEIVSSPVGDIHRRPAGRGDSGELKLSVRGSTDGALHSASTQQQSLAINTAGTTTAARSSRKLYKGRPATNDSSTRVTATAIDHPAVSTALSSSSSSTKFGLQQKRQQDGHATTATMTSIMQQSKRRSFSLTLTVDEPPRHISRASPSPPPVPNFSFPSSSSASPSANENLTLTLMPNPANDPYPPPFVSTVISKPTGVGFSEPGLVDDSKSLLQDRALDSVNPTSPAELRNTIKTPVGYYLTPSQTPTPLDRSDPSFNPPSVPTVVRPGPSTPPLIEPPVPVSSAVARVTNPTVQARPQRENGPSILIPDDRSLENGPPTPASSTSSQRRRVSFAEEAPIPANSLVLMRSNVGNSYSNPPQQNRFDQYRPPPPRHSISNHPRNYGPNQPPFRGPPRGRLLLRGPPRPPSPIFVSPPDMKNHMWQPLKDSQLECSMGHNMIPFRNKQHSIACTVCRSMEFEGRGEPVKRSFYCSWCAVRMCGHCREELMSVCGGRLAELWDRTEEKRDLNMTMIRENKRVDKRDNMALAKQTPDRGSGESFGSGWSAAMDPVGDRGSNKTPQGIPGASTEDAPPPTQKTTPRGQSEFQSMIPRPQQSTTPRPQQSPTPRPQQSTTPRPQQSPTPRPQQSTTPRPQQSPTPRPQQSTTPQPQQSPTPRPQQSTTPQPQQPPVSQTQQSRVYRSQRTKTPQPQQSTIPRTLQPGTYQSQLPRAPQPQKSSIPQPQRSTPPPQSSGREHRKSLPNHGPPSPEKPNEYVSERRTPLNQLTPKSQGSYPPPVSRLTLEESQKYRLVAVPSSQKPPSSGTVVLVDEEKKEPGISTPSLKGSVTKKKRNWLRGFGKRKDV